MRAGRQRGLGQEPPCPQREGARGLIPRLLFLPSLGSPPGWSCPLAELSGEPENMRSAWAAAVQMGRVQREMSRASLRLVPSSPFCLCIP